jgi:hypothetical protein
MNICMKQTAARKMSAHLEYLVAGDSETERKTDNKRARSMEHSSYFLPKGMSVIAEVFRNSTATLYGVSLSSLSLSCLRLLQLFGENDGHPRSHKD